MGTITENPYPGPRPFAPTPQEARVFFGREREAADLEDLLYSYRSVLLYSQSGAGKSSLVSAGLLAGLDRSRWLLGRVGGDDDDAGSAMPPGANIFVVDLLRSTNQPLSGDQPLTLEVRLARHAHEPWFLVIDQFEELFTAHPEFWQDREAFFLDLGALLKVDSSCRILFVMREEYVAEVEAFGRLLPDGFEIRYRLTGLRQDAALRAIIQPAEGSGDRVRAERIRKISDQLVLNLLTVPIQTRAGVKRVPGEFAEPLYLQVICRDLWDRLAKTPSLEAAALIDVDRLLGRYYETALRRAAGRNPLRERKMRGWFESFLITAAGTRGIVYLDEEQGTAAGMPEEAVETFADERLVRMERRAGARWYELTHDRLILPILTSNREFRTTWNRRLAGSASLVVLLLIGFFLPNPAMMAPNAPPVDHELQARADTAEEDQRALRLANDIGLRALAASSPADAARAYSTFGLTALSTGDGDTSRRYLDMAKKANPLEAVRTIDQYIVTSGNTRGGFTAELERARQEFMGDLADYFPRGEPATGVESRPRLEHPGPHSGGMPDPGVVRRPSAPEPGLKQYACAHGIAVVGANVPSSQSGQEVKRLKDSFPNARVLWSDGGRDRIVLDSFLTCDAAASLRDAAVAQLPQGASPYLRQWYPGCGGCESRAGKPRQVTSTPGAGPSLSVADPLSLRVLALSGSLETGQPYPASFGEVFGDFAGQGLSLGVLQWSLAGTLQPLMAEMVKTHPLVVAKYLDEQTLKKLLPGDVQASLAWARSMQDAAGRVREPLRSKLSALAMSPEFRKIQTAKAQDKFLRARALAEEYGLASERAVALMFDIIVQSGNISQQVRARILADFRNIPDGPKEEVEVAKMMAVIHRRAEVVRPPFQDDIRLRKTLIARGSGIFHGSVWDLDRQFALRLVDAQ